MAVVVVLWLTGWSALRTWASASWRQPLGEYGSQGASLYLGLSGAAWGSIGCALLIGLLSRRRWSGMVLVGAAFVFTIWYWLERLLSQPPRPNWPFAALLNLVVLTLLTATGIALAKEAHD